VDEERQGQRLEKTQVSQEEGVATKSSQKKAEKTSTLQMLNAESKGPPAFNNIYNERNPTTF